MCTQNQHISSTASSCDELMMKLMKLIFSIFFLLLHFPFPLLFLLLLLRRFLAFTFGRLSHELVQHVQKFSVSRHPWNLKKSKNWPVQKLMYTIAGSYTLLRFHEHLRFWAISYPLRLKTSAWYLYPKFLYKNESYTIPNNFQSLEWFFIKF